MILSLFRRTSSGRKWQVSLDPNPMLMVRSHVRAIHCSFTCPTEMYWSPNVLLIVCVGNGFREKNEASSLLLGNPMFLGNRYKIMNPTWDKEGQYQSMCCADWSSSQDGWLCHPGDVQQYLDICWWSYLGSWHVSIVGRIPRCYSTSYNEQDSLHGKDFSGPKC